MLAKKCEYCESFRYSQDSKVNTGFCVSPSNKHSKGLKVVAKNDSCETDYSPKYVNVHGMTYAVC